MSNINEMDLSKLKELKEMEKAGTLSVVLPRTNQEARKLPNRVLTLEQVYLQGGDTEPLLFELREATNLQSEEQPFDRVLKVGEDWQLLSPGSWIPEPGLLLLYNQTKLAGQVNPTEGQQKALAEAVLEVRVGLSPPFSLIPPGKGIRVLPACPIPSYQIRCQAGSARYRVVLMPR